MFFSGGWILKVLGRFVIYLCYCCYFNDNLIIESIELEFICWIKIYVFINFINLNCCWFMYYNNIFNIDINYIVLILYIDWFYMCVFVFVG